MNCSKADEYFMKYIDNCLTAAEAEKLHKHLAVCEKCRADFAIYDSIAGEFSDMEFIIDAPAGFEEAVMEKIKELPAPKAALEKSINTVLMAVGIGFVSILALGFIIFINRDIIIELAGNYPQLAGYVAFLTPVSEYVTSFMGNIWNVALNFSVAAFAFVSGYKYVILVAALALLAIQFALRGRSKEKVKVEE